MKFKNKKSSSADHGIKELEQEKNIFEGINELLSSKTEELEKAKRELEVQLSNEVKKSKELEQGKIILEERSEYTEKRATSEHKKFYFILTVIVIAASSAFVAYSFFENQSIGIITSHILENYRSNYIIQNLKGDTVNTWVAWNIPDGRVLHVSIVNTANLSQDKIDAIKDAILSTKTVTLDDSLLGKGPQGTSSVYYTGWEGALTEAYSQPTTSYIPQKFDVNGSPNGPGDIVIILTNDVNPDGLSGLTKSIADGNEILKSKITIYSASELSVGQLTVITRHEFGHAMGLAHSTAPEDLMHATIQTDYPYISGCDIDAIKGLYDGDKNSKVVCQK